MERAVGVLCAFFSIASGSLLLDSAALPLGSVDAVAVAATGLAFGVGRWLPRSLSESGVLFAIIGAGIGTLLLVALPRSYRR